MWWGGISGGNDGIVHVCDILGSGTELGSSVNVSNGQRSVKIY